MRTPRSSAVAKLLTITGVLGHLGKGATLIAVGILVIVSGVTGDPEKSTGVDGALKAMREQPSARTSSSAWASDSSSTESSSSCAPDTTRWIDPTESRETPPCIERTALVCGLKPPGRGR